MMNEDDGTDEENRDTVRGGDHDDDHGRDRDEAGDDGGGSDGGSSSEEEESSGSSSEEEEEEEEEDEEIDPSLCMMADVQYHDVFVALQDERIFDKFPIGDAAKTLESLLRLKVTTPGENLIEAFLKLNNGEDQGTKRNGQQAQEDQQGQGQNHGNNNNNENQQSSIMNNIIEYPVIVEVCYLLGFYCPQTPVHMRNPQAVRCRSPRRGHYRPVTLAYAVDVLIRLLRCLGDIHGRTTASYTKRNLFDDFQLLMNMHPQYRHAVLDFFDQSLTVAAEERNRGGGGDGGESLICKAWPAKFIFFFKTQIANALDERDFLSVAGILVANHNLWGDDNELVDLVTGLYDCVDWNGDGRIIRMGKGDVRGKSAVWLPVFHHSSNGGGTYRWPCPSSFSNLTALQELHLNGCTSLVSIPNLKRLYLKDTVLDMKCLQDLCFPRLELLQIEPNAKTRDKHVSCKLVSKDISPCLKYFKLLDLSIPEEDYISCFASLASCTLPKTLMRVDVRLNVLPRQALETLFVDLAPKLGDHCEIKVGFVDAEKIRWLANKLQSAPPINIRYLMFQCLPGWYGDKEDENWKAVEYIADKCNAVFPHCGCDRSVIKAAKSYYHKTLIRYAGNDLLDPNDITNIRDTKSLPISVWPTILQRADQKSNIDHIWNRILNGPPDPEFVGGTGNDHVDRNTRSRIHSGLFHLLRYGPILSHLSGDVGYEEKKKKKELKEGSDIENGDGDYEPTTMTMKRKSCASSTSRSATVFNLEKKARNT